MRTPAEAGVELRPRHVSVCPPGGALVRPHQLSVRPSRKLPSDAGRYRLLVWPPDRRANFGPVATAQLAACGRSPATWPSCPPALETDPISLHPATTAAAPDQPTPAEVCRCRWPRRRMTYSAIPTLIIQPAVMSAVRGNSSAAPIGPKMTTQGNMV